jgi:hypothetical protein
MTGADTSASATMSNCAIRLLENSSKSTLPFNDWRAEAVTGSSFDPSIEIEPIHRVCARLVP